MFFFFICASVALFGTLLNAKKSETTRKIIITLENDDEGNLISKNETTRLMEKAKRKKVGEKKNRAWMVQIRRISLPIVLQKTTKFACCDYTYLYLHKGQTTWLKERNGSTSILIRIFILYGYAYIS